MNQLNSKGKEAKTGALARAMKARTWNTLAKRALAMIMALMLAASLTPSVSLASGGGGVLPITPEPLEEGAAADTKCGMYIKDAPFVGFWEIDRMQFEFIAEGDIDGASMIHFRLRMPANTGTISFELPNDMKKAFKEPDYSGIFSIDGKPTCDIYLSSIDDAFVFIKEGTTILKMLVAPSSPASPVVTDPPFDYGIKLIYIAITAPGPDEDDPVIDLVREATDLDALTQVDMYSMYDVNRDRKVTLEDVEAVRSRLGMDSQSPGWNDDPITRRCDFNRDGVIDFRDLQSVVSKLESL